MSDKKILVYLANTSSDSSYKKDELAMVLSKAGMEICKTMSEAHCSVHIFGKQYAPLKDGAAGMSLVKYEFYEAKKRSEQDKNYKIFIWTPTLHGSEQYESRQEDFINEVRNNIGINMVYSNVDSPIQFVEDIRSISFEEEKEVFSVKNTDVFLICNQLDEKEAAEISEMLSDIVPVERLNIIQDSDIDYPEFCSQQMGKSKLAVVYFKQSADWALPFAQMVWKKTGGASSQTPILLIGDEDPGTNANKTLKAPKVISMIAAGELIPLEIKVQFDKLIEGI